MAGGKRVGSGRKKLDRSAKKVRMLLNFDPTVAEWVRDKADNQYSKFVNNILKDTIDLEPKAKIITLVNQAGGVAKTTMTMNIGYQLAKLGHRVLLIDLDPQASLTDFMGLESYNLEQTVGDSLLDENIDLIIHPDLHSMDLSPSNLDLSATEFKLVAAIGREMRLKSVLKKHLSNYDFILIDCPPNLGILSAIGLTAATHVLVPVETQYKAYQGVDNLLFTIDTIRTQVNPGLKIAGFIPTRHANTKQNIAILAALHENLSEIAPIYEPVPRATAFADASMAHVPLGIFARSHPAVAILESIAKSLEELNV
jgi:chromosome partitioning protein